MEKKQRLEDRTQSIEISKITIDKSFMMRDALDKKLVAEYKENLKNMPPISLYDTPQGLLLVDGFHRLTAAKQLNWKNIDAIVAKGSIQDAFGVACLSNLRHGKPLKPEERKKAICQYIKLNSKLSNVLIAEHTSVVESTIRNYRNELVEKGELKPETKRIGSDGRTTTTPTVSTSQKNEVNAFDVWFDEHVFEGDVFDVLNTDSLKYDLAIIDPPYGITQESWDKKDKFELLNFTRRWLNLVLQRLKPSGRLFIFWSREYLFDLKPLLDEIKAEYPLNFGGLIVWNFRNTLSIPNNRKELKITWEPIFYFYGLDATELNRPDTELSGEKWTNETDADVWVFAVPQTNFADKKIHPAQKPLELYKHIIELSTKTNDLILDPFAGSGTTGHAAYELGRDFRLIEKNAQYVDLIRGRLKGVFNNGK